MAEMPSRAPQARESALSAATEIRALIVDDEPLARRGIRQLLAPYPQVVVVGESRDGREAVRALATLNPDLVFLDVEMPGLDGLGVIRAHGADRMPATVFVTAHEQFAVRAFEIEALDYLVKPLAERRFRATMARVLERLGGDAARLVVPTAAGRAVLEPDAIIWIEADGDHARVHAAGTTYRLRASLRELQQRLGVARFMRVHRGALVRRDAVREVRLGRPVVLLLRDGTTVPVGRRRAGAVRALLEGAARRSAR